MKNLSKIHSIYFIIILGFVSRVIAAIYFGDTKLENEWAILFHNFKISGTYGFNVALADFYAAPKFAESNETIIPSAFMPPLYFFFIFLVDKLSFDFCSTVQLLIFVQIVLNLISITILYKILIKFVNKFSSNLICLVFAFFPINIYGSVQVSSITLQIFLILGFLFYLLELLQKKNFKNIIIFSFFSGLLILIRGEFFIFYLFSLIYFFIFYKKKIKILFISIILTSIVISPYVVRNFINFDTIVLTKSFGYNLLKGNNPSIKVEGDPEFIETNFNRKDLKIKTNNKYEINLDNFYKTAAIEYLKEEPTKYIRHYFLKVFSFISIDLNSSYPNYYHPMHIIPKLLVSFFSILGILTLIKKKGFFQFLSIFYLLNIFLFSIFFILPRYSLILLPVKLLLSSFIIEKLGRKYVKKLF